MAELTKLGRYKLVRVLGRGAMGVVYEGLDPALNRRVAVKTILRNAAIDDETARAYSAQFAREAQAAGRLNHPNIVQVHDFSEEGDVAYLVMEYIQGRELRSYFEAKEAFATPEAVRVMGELLDALHFAHEAGVIHRDIKPANVMLDAQRRVKLADFGVARIQDSERSAAGTMVGTPAFMSPEQIQGGKIDRRTDIFSAGVVLYQLLTGEQPFTGAGAWTVAKKIMQDDPPRPSAVVKSIAPGFDEVVNKALAKDPAQRYASARDFALALRAVEGDASQPRATATLPPAAAPAKAAGKASEAEVEFWRAIQNSTDAAEFEFYLEQFPEGTYAPLARHKIAKLKEPAEAAQKEAEDKARLAAEAEAKALREAAAAEVRARQEAEEKARRLAEEKAQLAAAQARREAEEKARREALEKAQREAEEAARRAAAERAKREAEERARQAAALAKLKQEEEARAKATAAVHDPEATIALPRPATAAKAPAAPAAAQKPLATPAAPRKSLLVPAIAGAVVVIGGAVAYFAMNRVPAPAPVAVAPSAPAAPVVDEAKIRREVEERIRQEFADKAAAEKAQMEKAVAERAAAERAAAEKLASAKTVAEKEAAEKAAQKATADRVAAEKAAAEKAAAAKAAADKAVAEKALADKAAAEKLAADKAAAEKAAAEKAAKAAPAVPVAQLAPAGRLPAVGDRWVYEAVNSRRPDQVGELLVEVRSVSSGAVGEHIQRPNGQAVDVVQRPGLLLTGIGPGTAALSPYLHLQQELRAGERWSNLEFRSLGICNSNPAVTCDASARVVGRERVAVKAGSFDAWKVVVDVNVKQNTRGSLEFTFWYADEAKRLVKYQSRGRYAGWPEPDVDMQLASYTPAGAKPAARPAETAARAEPAPVATPVVTPAPAAVAAAAPSSAAAAPGRPGVPSVGDRWVYEAREAMRPDRRYEFAVEALAVGAGAIRDVVRGPGGAQMEHKPGAYIIGGGPGVAHFSPYLRAFQDWKEGQRWASVEFEKLGACSNNPQWVCSLEARVLGRERVSVKAGTYEATKILVESTVSGGFGGSIEFTFWFADDAKRFVKMQSRMRRGRGSYQEMDVELLSYAPAGR